MLQKHPVGCSICNLGNSALVLAAIQWKLSIVEWIEVLRWLLNRDGVGDSCFWNESRIGKSYMIVLQRCPSPGIKDLHYASLHAWDCPSEEDQVPGSLCTKDFAVDNAWIWTHVASHILPFPNPFDSSLAN